MTLGGPGERVFIRAVVDQAKHAGGLTLLTGMSIGIAHLDVTEIKDTAARRTCPSTSPFLFLEPSIRNK